MGLTEISFFGRFEADILSGKKTITIRDEAEKNFTIGTTVQVSTFETNRWFCELLIKDVQPISIDQLTEYHAKQENMTLDELKSVIDDIYPGINNLYVISYSLLNN
ncbi:MAG: ASCH domain-containing protein [Psychromonas sp.]|nr:ASCH domain-containing protein [Alteromonadales bacterium]MCP5076646.1 ASCH domain-containing protein [Psychromonas sp.]